MGIGFAKWITPTTAPLWVAVVGGIITAMGYVVTYYKDTEENRSFRENQIILQLLSDDPKESSRNLLWAHDAKIITLPDVAVHRLIRYPEGAPSIYLIMPDGLRRKVEWDITREGSKKSSDLLKKAVQDRLKELAAEDDTP